MTDTLFTNVASSTAPARSPTPGSVLVQGNRIARVGRGTRGARRAAGATVIDGAGATLMPGMCEAHTHFSLERRRDAGRHPDDAARGARAVVRRRSPSATSTRAGRRASAPPAPSRGSTS